MKQFIMKYSHFKYTDKERILGDKSWKGFRKYNGRQGLWDGGYSIGKNLSEMPWACPTDDLGTPCSGLWSPGRDGHPHVIHAPQKWTSNLPKKVPLVGELWINDNLREVSSVVSVKNPNIFELMDWEDVKFIPFNIKPYCEWPQANIFGDNYWWEPKNLGDVWMYLCGLIKGRENKILKLPYVTATLDQEWEINDAINNSIANNWEGIIFADLNSIYDSSKLSKQLLKFKVMHDCEALIIGHETGKAGHRFEEMIGSLVVETTWGEGVESMPGGKKEFIGKTVSYEVALGMNDEERDWLRRNVTWKPMTEIKLQFNGLTAYGVPQHARIAK